MKILPWIALLCLLAVSCVPAAVSTPTLAPPTEAPPPTQEPATEVPTLAPASLAGPQSGTSLLWLDGATLLLVPGGEFTMGAGTADDPEVMVYLDDYWFYATPVTNKMYSQCVTTGNCAPPAQEVGSPVYTNPLYGDFPVVGVTWDMADNYCGWARAALPTEAQWEKAARGIDGSPYPWGLDAPDCSLANFEGCVGHTTDVLDFSGGRSPYGVFDMAGNVFEWASDFYAENAYEIMAPRNPAGPDAGDSHVLRGSSYETELPLLPSAVRHFGASGYHSGELGFRCAVSEPPAIAPYCQLSSYIPTGAGPSPSACELPQLGIQRNYCEGRRGYATITIPEGASYDISGTGYECSDAIVNGERLVTCTGPDLSSGELQVCNPACAGAPSETGEAPVCDPGYSLDASTGACVYSPADLAAGVAGCPLGYSLIQRGDSKICALGLNQNGQCGAGTYFDGQYGACVSPAAGADAPYGINDPIAASQILQGCAAGYTYDPGYQCCQAVTGGTYPGCPVGFAADSARGTCIPHRISITSPGCVAVSMNIARCQPIPEDLCSTITNESLCKFNALCEWHERQGFCRLK